MGRTIKIFIALGFLSLTSVEFVLSRRIKDKNEFPDLGIVNGKKSTVMKPWLCSLWKNNRLSCGCSIISSRKILTAAHCLKGDSLFPSDLKIGVGDLHKDLQTKYPVKSFINHPSYSVGTPLTNDVAIITLEVPIIFINGFIAPITLYKDCDKKLPVNSSVFIQGWGRRDPKIKKGSDHLYEAEIKILDFDDVGCTKYENKGWMSNTMICAGYPHGGIDSCAGDSGGPLVTQLNEQIGIVSWGDGCAESEAPGVYTYICEVKDWISNPTGTERINEKNVFSRFFSSVYDWIFN